MSDSTIARIRAGTGPGLGRHAGHPHERARARTGPDHDRHQNRDRTGAPGPGPAKPAASAETPPDEILAPPVQSAFQATLIASELGPGAASPLRPDATGWQWAPTGTGLNATDKSA